MTIPFSSEVKNQFSRVAQQFGLTCVESTDRKVRYENDDVFLSINIDNGRSYELGVEVGKKKPTQSEIPYSLAEVLRLQGVAKTIWIDGMMVSNAAQLQSALAQLATLTLQYAADLLSGSEFSFVQLAKLREKECDAYALENELRSARARSEEAWIRRDYKAVMFALEPLKEHLSLAEKKRLDYARKHSTLPYKL